MKIWQSLIYRGIFILGVFFLLASIGALIEIQIWHFIMFLVFGLTTIILSVLVETYFEENSTEKYSMDRLDLL